MALNVTYTALSATTTINFIYLVFPNVVFIILANTYFMQGYKMIEAQVQTLVVFAPPTPAAVVLSPKDNALTIKNADGSTVTPIIPIWIGQAEAISLGSALNGRALPRPGTHDLLLNMMTSLDALLKEVHITQYDGKIFYANVICTQYGREIILDSRPSDAITLAVRFNAPILVENKLFEQHSLPFIVKKEINDELRVKEFHDFLENLTPEDFSC